tara:strand:+ start:70 stop:765 length:696 start_codon:yes stop_codon:yes gene_type:complete
MRMGSITTDIIRNGLVFNMDAANRVSYIPDATTAFNTIDLSNSGSLINDTFYDSSTISPSFAFDGTADYINLGNPSLFQLDNITICGWFNINSSANTYYNIIAKWSTSSDRVFGLYMTNSDGKLYWWCSHNGTQPGTQTVSATNLKDGNWHFFAAMKDGTNQTLYIDNLSPVTVSGTSGVYNNSVFANIGRSESGNGYDWNGNIGPMHIYNRALSSTEVLHNYNALKSRFE